MSERLPGWDAPELVSLADCGVKGGVPGDRVVLCEQRSTEWLALRRGAITASHASDIIGISGKPSTSTSRERYLYELVAERITGSATEHYPTWAMKRGQEYEPEARAWYAHTVRPVQEVGFVWRSTVHRDIGCSPDGLCEDRLLEIKCVMPSTHCRMLATMAKAKHEPDAIDAAHRLQMQFQMWVVGLPLCDYVLYQPPMTNLPCKVVTVSASASLHAAFEEVIPAFSVEVTAAVEAITKGQQ